MSALPLKADILKQPWRIKERIALLNLDTGYQDLLAKDPIRRPKRRKCLT